MILYQLPYSHNCAKVTVALLEKGLAYEAPPVTLADLRTPEFLARNPLGRVPFLVDGDFAIGESEVIVEYLEDRYPEHPLLPADAKGRARCRWLSRFHDLYLGPQLSTLYFALTDGRKGRPEFAAEVEKLHSLVATFEQVISPDPYFLGSRFTLADAPYALSYLYVCMLSGAHGRPIPESQMPRYAAWYAEAKKRPSVERVIAAAEAALGVG